MKTPRPAPAAPSTLAALLTPFAALALLALPAAALADPAAPEPAPGLPEETPPGELPDEPPPSEAPPEATAPPPPADAPPADLPPADSPPDGALYYPEEAAGESSLTLGYGVGGWFTDRGPLAGLATVAPVIGYDHRIGPARLGWRLHLYLDPVGDDPLTFLYADLLSVEYVFAQERIRPYARLALGFGLDLADGDVEIDGEDPGLGDDGYFNEANGATGGPGLTLGAGIDAFVAERLFLRLEALARGYGGAGPAAAMWGASLALGLVL
ncbi:MAG: hypothetical protein H6703_09155 [Myxococcales bacterium]|nr:hypothetical protein [Myxococcales bacterium]